MMNPESVAQKKNKKQFLEFFALGIPAFSAYALIVLIILLLAHFIWHGMPGMSWAFLTEAPRNNNTEGGIFPAIYGTVILVFIMSLLGVPIGTATAVYLSEYAKQSSIFARAVRFGVNTLAGVPSIVFGLFGVGFFMQFIGKGIDTTLGSDIWSKLLVRSIHFLNCQVRLRINSCTWVITFMCSLRSHRMLQKHCHSNIHQHWYCSCLHLV